MTLLNTKYPVFEADQVLSQKHLNGLVSYLEEQDRASRIHLLGIGIACGLELSFPAPNSVHISCGTGITSLGFLIPFEAGNYTHFKETTLSDGFLFPDTEKHEYLEGVLEYVNEYQAFQETIELLKEEEVAAAVANNEKVEKLSDEVLKGKVVMLLLEVGLIDEKNCVTIDCNDKGKRIEFKVRVLLIEEKLLSETKFSQNFQNTTYLDPIKLVKFNSPKTNLITGYQVLNQYDFLINKEKKKISDAIKRVHDQYHAEFNTLSKYGRLGNVLHWIDKVYEEQIQGIHIQYVWEWLHDIVATYNEIIAITTYNLFSDCIDKGLFPFHLLLGTTEQDTKEDLHHHHRTPFFKVGVFSEEAKQQKEKLTILLEKLIHQVDFFALKNEVKTGGIKITPSVLTDQKMDKKAIPFYYDEIAILNNKWSPELAIKNKSHHLLSYNSDVYNVDDEFVTSPLEYDTEAYDFYRIEGHLGKNYVRALTDIIAQQEQHRLPFKTIALNAVDYRKQIIDVANQKGTWDDMELDYDLAKEKLYNITEHVMLWIEKNKGKIQKLYSIMTDQAIGALRNILSESRELLPENLTDFLPNHEQFNEVFGELNDLFLFHRACIDGSTDDLAQHSIIEDFADHLDEVNKLFLEDPFTILYEEANRRWQKTFKELFLSKFLEKHPGINPKSGVSKGGTFVLVYADSSVFKTVQKTFDITRLQSNISDYKKVFKFTSVQLKDLASLNVVKTKALKKQQLKGEKETAEQKKIKINYKNQVLRAAKENMVDLPDYTKKYLTENIEKAFDEKEIIGSNTLISVEQSIRNIPEKVVLADFYLPYICCGEGNNINVLIGGDEKEEPIPPSILLDQTIFCMTDKEEYTIHIENATGNGEFLGETGKVISKKTTRTAAFTPSKLGKAGSFTIQYEEEELTSNSIAIILKQPVELTLQANRTTVKNKEIISFSLKNAVTGHRYKIDFGDGTVPKVGKAVTWRHGYNIATTKQTFKVTVTDTESLCGETNTVTITVINSSQTTSVFDIRQKVYKHNDDKTYKFTTDADFNIGLLKNPNKLTFNSNNPLSFSPSKQNLGRSRSKTYPLEYKGKKVTIRIDGIIIG